MLADAASVAYFDAATPARIGQFCIPQVANPTGIRTPEGWKKLLNYLEENRDSLWYGRRLKEGLPIGSGLIEGGGKNTLAKRLKINSARWRIQRAERMGAIRCLQYSHLWESYWDSKAAA